MIKFFGPVQDGAGNKLVGYSVRIIDSTGAQVSITADESGTNFQPTANLAPVDDNGMVQFWYTPEKGQDYQILSPEGLIETTIEDFSSSEAEAASGLRAFDSLADIKAAPASALSYNLVGTSIDGIFNYETANAPYTADDVNVIKLDSTALSVGALVRQSASSIRTADNKTIEERLARYQVATIAALEALSPNAGDTAYLRADRLEGMFKYYTDDFSSLVSLDTLKGLYIPPASDPTGASGTWARIYDGTHVNVKWFGALGNNIADDTAALAAAAIMASNKVLYFPIGSYTTTLPLLIPGNTMVQGENRWFTQLIWKGGASKPTVNVRRPITNVVDFPINAMMVLSFFSPTGGATLGAQRLTGLTFLIDPTGGVGSYVHHCDNAVYVDSPTTIIDECYFQGQPKSFDNALLRFSKNTTFNSKVTNNVMRGIATTGNYDSGDFANLDEQTPMGVQVGACQALVIDKNVIQNCQRLIDIRVDAEFDTTPKISVTNNHLEQGFNANDPDNRAIYLDCTLGLLVHGNEFFLGPSTDAGAGNPAPHIGIEIVNNTIPTNLVRQASITGNSFRSISSASYLAGSNAPYFVEVNGDANHILGVTIDDNAFIGRKYPVNIIGTPIVAIGDRNTNDQTNSGMVTYSDVNFDTAVRPLALNDTAPFIGHGDWFSTNNTIATTITDFEGGREGHVKYIRIGDANTSIQVSATGSLRSQRYQLFRSPGATGNGLVKLAANSLIIAHCQDRVGNVYYIDIIDGPICMSDHLWSSNSMQMGSYKFWVHNNILYMKNVVSGGVPTSPTDGIVIGP